MISEYAKKLINMKSKPLPRVGPDPYARRSVIKESDEKGRMKLFSSRGGQLVNKSQSYRGVV